MSSKQQHPFLDPLWRRVVIVAFCAGWSVLEWINQQTGWGMLTAAATVYGVWSLLLTYEAGKSKSETGGQTN